jgi:hypothetical protein
MWKSMGLYQKRPAGSLSLLFRGHRGIHTIERMADLMAHELDGRGRVAHEEFTA